MHGAFMSDLLKTFVLLFRQIAFEADPALNAVDEAFRFFDAFRAIASVNSSLL